MPIKNSDWVVLAIHLNPTLSGTIAGLRNYGYVIHECSDFDQGKDFLAENSVSIVLLEAILQDQDGIEVLNYINRLYPYIDVVLMAQFGDFETAARAVELGVATFLQIPFTTETLLKRIQWIRKKKNEQKPEPSQNNFRSLINAFIEKSINLNIAMPDLAAHFNMSKSTLHRKIKCTFGVSFQDFIDRVRLEKTKQLLENRDYKIIEIAERLGFTDNNYFSKWFKQHTKFSPSEYRRLATPRASSVRIGVLAPLTGVHKAQSLSMIRGAEMALEPAFYKFGYDIDIFPIDTATNPCVGSKRTYEAAKRYNLRFFLGCANSSVLQSVAKAASETKSLLIGGAGVDIEEGMQSRSVFRWLLATKDVPRKALKSYLGTVGKNQRIFTITPDYIFGYTLLQKTKEALQYESVEHVGNRYHNLGAQNFQPIFQKALEAKADTILLLNFGIDTISALEYAYNRNLNNRLNIFAMWANVPQMISSLGLEKVENVYFGTQYWHETKLPANKAFVDCWSGSYNCEPSFVAANSYISLYLYLMAIQKTGKPDDVAEVAEALDHLVWNGLTAPKEFMIPYTHQTKKEYYLLKIENGQVSIKDPVVY
ncbi:MAG: ABC transporter substrate-binding protein [Spirochaetales bacterium]|nr:ABC transporter substrate-binding protein [Spirochaetales bacterium]MCF7939218.1 ABC transporter substrate-binding protein [Spirochaetales bacterium]